MDVLDDDHERALLGETFEETTPRGERLVAAVTAELGLAREPEERQ